VLVRESEKEEACHPNGFPRAGIPRLGCCS
jgi:hypothetical protein